MNTARLGKWGNSTGLRIPKEILESVGFTNNQQVLISIEDNNIVIEKVESSLSPFAQLFEGYNDDYHPTLVDWGTKKGSEEW